MPARYMVGTWFRTYAECFSCGHPQHGIGVAVEQQFPVKTTGSCIARPVVTLGNLYRANPHYRIGKAAARVGFGTVPLPAEVYRSPVAPGVAPAGEIHLFASGPQADDAQ